MFLLHKRLKHIKLRLKEWNKSEFGNIFVETKSIEDKMQELKQALITDGFDKVRSDQAAKHHQYGRICVNKRKYFGAKNLEFNG